MGLRLDQALVAQKLCATRSRASDAVQRGHVAVNGKIVTKAGFKVSDSDLLTLDDPAKDYVSRAALKLKALLEAFGLSPEHQTILDIGASTGGFTQICLEHGAKHVMALDAGHGQLVASLRQDPRVTAMDGVNARYLDEIDLIKKPDAIVMDVSFISIELILPVALPLITNPNGWAAILVKPQFEAGKARIGKNGIVQKEHLPAIYREKSAYLSSFEGWVLQGMLPSPIKGGDGNTEYIAALRKT